MLVSYLVPRYRLTSPLVVPVNVKVIGPDTQPSLLKVTAEPSAVAFQVVTSPELSVIVKTASVLKPVQLPPSNLTFAVPKGVVSFPVIFQMRVE
jgi:hypothetical protein